MDKEFNASDEESVKNAKQKEKNRLCAKIEERINEMEQADLNGLQVGHDYYNLQLA